MAGKAGYYKRKQMQTKSVTKTVDVHDGELAIDENAASNMYQMSVAQSQPAITEGLDISSLPFFQMNRGTPLNLPNGASSSQLSLPSCEDAQQGLSETKVTADKEMNSAESDDDFDGKDDSILMTSQVMTHLQMGTAKAKAQAAAPKAKAKPKPKADSGPANPKGRKLASAEAQVLNLDGAAAGGRSGRAADGDQQDQALVDSWSNVVKDHQAKVLVCDSDTDSAMTDCLKTASKSLSTSLTQLKTKIKSLGRRQGGKGGSDFLTSELEGILLELRDAHEVVYSLFTLTGEDLSVLSAMEQMSQWKISRPFFKRALKIAIISNLKFKEWKSLTGCTFAKICELLGDEEGHAFFELMMNESIQRLLRNVSVKDVPRLELCNLFVYKL